MRPNLRHHCGGDDQEPIRRFRGMAHRHAPFDQSWPQRALLSLVARSYGDLVGRHAWPLREGAADHQGMHRRGALLEGDGSRIIVLAESRGYLQVRPSAEDARKKRVMPSRLCVAEYEAMVDG